MTPLATLMSALRPDPDPAALRAFASDPAALRLLTGPPPPPLIPLAALRATIAAETGLPDWLIDASRQATGDLTEALALLLPAATGPEPDPTEVLADLATLPPGPLALQAILALARRLPPEPRALWFRLVTGGYRPPLTPARLAAAVATTEPAAPRHSLLAVMIYAEAALATGARGPMITLALWDGPALVPVTRARANLPADQTPALMAWIRAQATGRFGPLRAVPARQVFALGFASVTGNRRSKSGLALTDPQILAWLPDTDPLDAAPLAALTALLPNTA